MAKTRPDRYPKIFNSKFAFPLLHEEELIVKKEVALLKGKNIVAKAKVTENNTFVSVVFTRSKKDGSKQMILNLKKLNRFVNKHFQMGSLQNVLELIRSGVCMASTDLKDAFYSVPIQNHQALLDIFCRVIFEICMYDKWIWTNHANIYKNLKNTFFYS